ncbi:relaxase/mobilization nuclease domain-containing protein [Rathayibacter sp. VKM Ac-2929]|uniref:relaxase/mobilization nuclease domain-containing protein n=1 Tax=Rathayibacter sp. VKM Ac-2929 TaxID=2929480 RepID=UPI001FB4A51F|nr:relaxase/mobilization nuclease domain-containing protein [Rathayibacter sp. VKM Ac-2929]MCJ1675654.1 relaxase/mobilization nuclease domain-containing protein [Rathayibacter sp. VKM Ac-2929]
MRTNITRGTRMGGLMSYLVGPGKTNEHTEQHLVAGDRAIMALYGHEVLDGAAAAAIAKDLDLPRRVFGVDVTRNQVRTDENGEAVRDANGGVVKDRVAADVWHCSLSLSAEEGQLTDEQWGRITTDFVQRMGFAGEDTGKADCRWVAVRHGLSKNGNDHVHIAVSLVREDGTKASVHKDFERSRTISRELERDYGLQVYQAPEREYAERGVRPGARESAERRGQDEPDMHRLERAVRAASSASQDEGEFVRRLRQNGVLVRPRFATGRDDVIAGYSVALRPTKGEKAIWHGGGRLARDLTLPELRKGWPDRPESAAAAASEWRATAKNPWRYEPVQPGREMTQPSPKLWGQYARELGALRQQMRTVPFSDRDMWARVARETSGAFAAWSRRVEPTPGPLAEASRALARSAHLRAHQSAPRPVSWPSAAGNAMVLLHVAQTGKPTVALALVMRELEKLSRAVHDMHKAAGDARRAQDIRVMMQQRLQSVSRQMPDVPDATTTATPAAAARSTLTAEQQQVLARMDAERGWTQGSPVRPPLQKREPDWVRDAPAPRRDRDDGRGR